MAWRWRHEPHAVVGEYAPAWQVRGEFFEDEEGEPLVRVKILQGGRERYRCVIPQFPETSFDALYERLAAIADRFRDPVGHLMRSRGLVKPFRMRKT